MVSLFQYELIPIHLSTICLMDDIITVKFPFAHWWADHQVWMGMFILCIRQMFRTSALPPPFIPFSIFFFCTALFSCDILVINTVGGLITTPKSCSSYSD